MQDLYFFSSVDRSFDDIIQAAGVVGVDHTVILDDTMNLYYHPDDFWQWYRLDPDEGDYEDFNATDIQRIERTGVCRAYCISHCPGSCDRLTALMRVLLSECGGWLAYLEPEGLAEIYTLESLDHFCKGEVSS